MPIVLNLRLVGLWVRLLTIPRPWPYAGILVFATLGTIGANPAMALVLYAIAAVALLLPLILGLRGRGEVLAQLSSDED